MRRCVTLCGPFCGTFKDIHESPPNSDDESTPPSSDGEAQKKDGEAQKKEAQKKDKDLPKQFRQIIGSKRVGLSKKAVKLGLGFVGHAFGKDDSSLAAASGWLPHLTSVVVEEREGSPEAVRHTYEAVKANGSKFNCQMLAKLSTLRNLHTIELRDCGIKGLPPRLYDLENLRVLRLPYNVMTKVAEGEQDVAKFMRVQEMNFESNKISYVDSRIFSDEGVYGLIYLTLSHNQLAMLPREFLSGAKKLRMLDLSHNSLQAIPESVFKSCVCLQVLNLDENNLSHLPNNIEHLQCLQKLFVSFNNLVDLPENIGECKKLTMIRAVSNRLRMIPESILKLSKTGNEKGCLKELLVLKNPLVQPSITAFEMGGLDQALHLFSMWIDEQKKEKAVQDANQKPTVSNEQEQEHVMYRDIEHRLSLPVYKRPSVAQLCTRDMDGDQDDEHSSVGHGDERQAKFFSDPKGLEEKIRSSESTMLFLKKGRFVEQLKKLAMAQREQHICLIGQGLTPHISRYTNPQFNASQYNGRVLVMDVDVCFSILVDKSQELHETCQDLFAAFAAKAPKKRVDDSEDSEDEEDEQDGEQGQHAQHMTKLNFDLLVNEVGVKFPSVIKNEMWEMLDWRKDHVLLEDFIAAWHIHSQYRSRSIKQHSEALRLEYYSLTMWELEELQESLNLKSLSDAEDEEMRGSNTEVQEDEEMRGSNTEVEKTPTDPLFLFRFTDDDDNKPVYTPEDWELLWERLDDNIVGTEPLEPAGPGSIMTAQLLRLKVDGDVDWDDEANDNDSLHSSSLSIVSDASSLFSAREVLKEVVEEAALEKERQREKEMRNRKKFQVDSDEALKQLMELPRSEIHLQARGGASDLPVRISSKNKEKIKRERVRSKGSHKDKRFTTDVSAVRQALREAYRSVPMADFKLFISFVLRSLEFIRDNDPKKSITHFHRDDPCFASAVRSNRYTLDVIHLMGFVSINNTYWVWPQRHLQYHEDAGFWGDTVVQPGFVGMHEKRLDDMILLFYLCKKFLSVEVKSFSGHLKRIRLPDRFLE
eukprot:TRINITY_DN2599_c0_g1_i1.p1 TRINITY_DN2599_c0_g1~~TRINITY_DN2599_c0_g1_i1.p1  ORF type:complete len:1039 (-),score=176.74 TRINITY_DN2599_c0_g1_i1:243-3359(-)